MLKSICVAILSAAVLAGCSGFAATMTRVVDYEKDPTAPSWAVDFGSLTAINTQAVLYDQRGYWTADRVVTVIGQRALGAAWLDDEKEEFALTYRTNAKAYPYCTMVWRWTLHGQWYGYVDFELHRTHFPLRAAVARGEFMMLGAWLEEQREIKRPEGGI